MRVTTNQPNVYLMKKIKLNLLGKITVALFIVFILIQFVPVHLQDPNTAPAKDFLHINQPSSEISSMMRNACYDCHSNATEFPWYSHVAPVSWMLESHIDEARAHINLSEWGNYPEKTANLKLEGMTIDVKEGVMPLTSYTWMHPKARLTDAQRTQLVDYLRSLEPGN